MKTIEITIDPKGEVTVQTSGFAGASCQDASRFIEQALGEKRQEQLTAEYFANQSQTQLLQHDR